MSNILTQPLTADDIIEFRQRLRATNRVPMPVDGRGRHFLDADNALYLIACHLAIDDRIVALAIKHDAKKETGK